MRNFRLGLLLISVAVLVIFIQQNLAPVLPLNFLGTKTVPLPLCLWILLALAAGSLTSGLISMLWKFQLSLNYGATGRYSRESPRDPAPRPTEPRESRTDRKQSGTANREPVRATAESNDFEPVAQWQDDDENWIDSDVEPDVGDRNWVDDDDENWVDEPIDRSPTSSRGETSSPPKTDYEVPQKPISNYQSGSVYSYSYQSPENTGVGTSESVNDAEYRVIVPPPSESADESLSEDDILEDDYSDQNLEPDREQDRSVVEPTPEPTPEPNPVYTTKVQPARSTPTKIQSDNQEDDWSQPRKKNNDDWV